MNNQVVINNQDITLILVISDKKKKLVKDMEALRATIPNHNEKSKQIHTSIFKSYEKGLKDIKNSLLEGEYYA